jgi:hypothetical protein
MSAQAEPAVLISPAPALEMWQRSPGRTNARGGILGRRKRGGFSDQVTPAEPSIPAALNGVPFAEAGSTAREGRPATCQYPDRQMPPDGPRKDRWVRELVGSIVSHQAPILLDRRDVELALNLSSATFDRRISDGKLPLDYVTVVGDRELYRREQVRAILLSPAGEVA